MFRPDCIGTNCRKWRYCTAHNKAVSTCPQTKHRLQEEAHQQIKAIADAQRERQQRGEDFQDEVRRSWRRISPCWRMRIADGKGADRPADEIILLQDFNILSEQKRTAGDRFELGFLRPNQLKGLYDFDTVLQHNYGLVFVSFLNEAEGIDEAYAFRLIAALRYMKQQGRKYITRAELYNEAVRTIYIPRIDIDGEPGYDLKGVNTCYKYLAVTT